jgi:hypothetical protein
MLYAFLMGVVTVGNTGNSGCLYEIAGSFMLRNQPSQRRPSLIRHCEEHERSEMRRGNLMEAFAFVVKGAAADCRVARVAHLLLTMTVKSNASLRRGNL